MSEIVVRMDIPKDCPMCPMSHWNKLDQFTGCEVAPGRLFEMSKSEEYRNSNTRPDWCPIIGYLPDHHGPLVDFDDVSKELRKYGYVVQNETTGMKYMEYPIVMELDPIRVPVIVPATKGGNK